jgi:hypothetical protein
MMFIEWDNKDDENDGDNKDDRDNKGSVECVPAKDIEVNKLSVWLPSRLFVGIIRVYT